MKSLFKKEEDPQVKPIQFKINKRDYIAEYDTTLKVQSEAEDVNVYGWTIETRYDWGGKLSGWSTYWGNKIYQSRESAVDAIMKIRSMYRDNDEHWRISPIYRMNEPQYRDYKINKVLGEDKKPETFEIKGWRLLEDYVYHTNTRTDNTYTYKKGTIFIQLESGRIIISGTSVSNHVHLWRKSFMEGVFTKGSLEEIEITDEKWLHPHLLKELKIKLKIKK